MTDDGVEHTNVEYITFHIDNNLGSDMDGIYFIQYTGNEDAIKKFMRINKKGDVEFFKEKYTYEQVMALRNFKHLWNYHSDNVERYIFSGKFTVPGKNKVYMKDELLKWWDKYLNGTKWPNWSKVCENIIDLMG